MSGVDWWRLGEWPSVPFVRRWVPVSCGPVPCEVRVFPGADVTVAVLRVCSWGKVLWTEAGRSATVRAAGPERIGESVASFLRRATAVGGGGLAGGAFPDAKFAKQYPALFEYMTVSQWPEGGDRKPCSLTLFAEDGVLKGCVSEKNDGLVLFGTGRTLEALLAALEGLLAGPDTPWRKSGGGVAPRGSKSR